MSESVPPSETEITQVLHNLMATQYALDKEDQETCFRLIRYSQEMKGLTKEEKKRLIENGLMDGADEKLTPPKAFIFRGTITSAFWLKCLLVIDGLISFAGEPNVGKETPPK